MGNRSGGLPVSRQMKINSALKHFDHGNRLGSHVNCLRLNAHNSLEHERKKFELAFQALKEGRAFLTEAILEGRNGIADFVDLENMTITEVLHTETEEELKEKVKSYPDAVRIEKVVV